MKTTAFSERNNISTPFKETLDAVSDELKLDIWKRIIVLQD